MSDQTAGITDLQIAVGYTTVKEIYDFLGFKPDRGHIALLSGQDAIEFLELCRRVEYDRAFMPGGAEGAETYFRLRLGQADLGGLKLAMGEELPPEHSADYAMRLIKDCLEEHDDYSEQVKDEYIKRLQPLMQTSFAALQQVPGANLQEKGLFKARRVQMFSAEGLGMENDPAMVSRGDEIVEHTRRLIDEINSRVYLDFIDKRSAAWASAENSPVKYDAANKRCYLSRADALKDENKYHVARCRYYAEIYADDLPGEVTPGKVKLAKALNEKVLVKQQFSLAAALCDCAAEAAEGVPGAFAKFDDILAADKLIGRRINFFTAFKRAHEFYAAERNLRRAEQMRINAGQSLDPAAENQRRKASQLKRKAELSLYKQAAKNVMSSAVNRTAKWLKSSSSSEKFAYAAHVFADYVEAKAEFDCRRLKNCFFHDKFPLHDPQKFKTEFLDGLKARGVTVDRAMMGFVEDMLNRTNGACRHLDELMDNAQIRYANKDGAFQQEYIDALHNFAAEFRSNLESCYQLPEKAQREQVRLFDQSKKPLYLVVPASERALLLSTYAEVGCDLKTGFLCVEDSKENRAKFNAYLPVQNSAPVKLTHSAQELLRRAQDELVRHGYTAADVRMDGKWHVDARDKSRSYVINLDGRPRMQLRDFNGSLNTTVMLGEPSQNELKELKQKIMREAFSAKAAAEQLKEEGAARLREQLKQLDESLLHGRSPYLEQKHVPQEVLGAVLCDEDGSQAARLAGAVKPGAETYYRNALILPLVNAAGLVTSCQIIKEDGEKVFAKGAAVAGSFYPIGGMDKLKQAKGILIAEGAATAATIAKYAPEGYAVAACMNCGNMQAVVKSLLAEFPDKGIGIMADNDVKTADVNGINPGMSAAANTVVQLRSVRSDLPVVSPPLTKKALLSGLSDFNDADQENPLLTKARVIEACQRVEQCLRRMNKARSAEQMNAEQVLLRQAQDKAAAADRWGR